MFTSYICGYVKFGEIWRCGRNGINMYLEEKSLESRDEDGIRIGKKKNIAKKDSL